MLFVAQQAIHSLPHDADSVSVSFLIFHDCSFVWWFSLFNHSWLDSAFSYASTDAKFMHLLAWYALHGFDRNGSYVDTVCSLLLISWFVRCLSNCLSLWTYLICRSCIFMRTMLLVATLSSINRSIDHSIDQLVKQTIDQTVNQSNNQPTSKYEIEQSSKQLWTDLSFILPLSDSTVLLVWPAIKTSLLSHSIHSFNM
jgi:hypothetical protein